MSVELSGLPEWIARRSAAMPDNQNPSGWPPAFAVSACEMHRGWNESQVQRGRNALSIYQDLVGLFGFENQYNSVKQFVRTLCKREPERCDVLEYLPGEECQFDYGQAARTRDEAIDTWDDAQVLGQVLSQGHVEDQPSDLGAAARTSVARVWRDHSLRRARLCSREHNPAYVPVPIMWSIRLIDQISCNLLDTKWNATTAFAPDRRYVLSVTQSDVFVRTLRPHFWRRNGGAKNVRAERAHLAQAETYTGNERC